MSSRLLSITLLLLIGALTAVGAHAQDQGPVNRISYFIAPDANGVDQVFQLLLDGSSQPRPITFATSDVLTYGTSHDGLGIAYISAGQLWLGSTHTDSAEAVAPVSATQFFGGPIYSPDGRSLAYADNGIWLVDLASRTTRLLIEDVPLDGADPAAFRMHRPDQFVLGPDGAASHLIFTLNVWEWQSAGVYDLSADTFQILEGQTHTDLLPIYGGRVLVFGNNGIAGEMALHLADDLSDINRYARVLDFTEVTDAVLFAERAVEIHPGAVRISGQTIAANPAEAVVFHFDYDLMADQAGPVKFLTLPVGQVGSTVAEVLSPDGAVLPVYVDALYSNHGTIYGALTLYDVEGQTPIAAPFPVEVSLFQWQR